VSEQLRISRVVLSSMELGSQYKEIRVRLAKKSKEMSVLPQSDLVAVPTERATSMRHVPCSIAARRQ
jgi:hypothetical protein